MEGLLSTGPTPSSFRKVSTFLGVTGKTRHILKRSFFNATFLYLCYSPHMSGSEKEILQRG